MVVLQGGPLFADQHNVAIVLASSLRVQAPPRPFEVYVGPAVGFHHDTVIDGRWVVTILKDDIPETARAFVLPLPVMDQVSVAIAAGLQL